MLEGTKEVPPLLGMRRPRWQGSPPTEALRLDEQPIWI
jgi:hypothetical protein